MVLCVRRAVVIRKVAALKHTVFSRYWAHFGYYFYKRIFTVKRMLRSSHKIPFLGALRLYAKTICTYIPGDATVNLSLEKQETMAKLNPSLFQVDPDTSQTVCLTDRLGTNRSFPVKQDQ